MKNFDELYDEFVIAEEAKEQLAETRLSLHEQFGNSRNTGVRERSRYIGRSTKKETPRDPDFDYDSLID